MIIKNYYNYKYIYYINIYVYYIPLAFIKVKFYGWGIPRRNYYYKRSE